MLDGVIQATAVRVKGNIFVPLEDIRNLISTFAFPQVPALSYHVFLHTLILLTKQGSTIINAKSLLNFKSPPDQLPTKNGQFNHTSQLEGGNWSEI